MQITRTRLTILLFIVIASSAFLMPAIGTTGLALPCCPTVGC